MSGMTLEVSGMTLFNNRPLRSGRRLSTPTVPKVRLRTMDTVEI